MNSNLFPPLRNLVPSPPTPLANIRGVVVVERGVDVLSVADGAPGVCSGCSLVSRPDVNTIGVFNQVSRMPERAKPLLQGATYQTRCLTIPLAAA